MRTSDRSHLFSRYVLSLFLLPNQIYTTLLLRWCKFFIVLAYPKSFSWTISRPLVAKSLLPLSPECVLSALRYLIVVFPSISPLIQLFSLTNSSFLSRRFAKPPSPIVASTTPPLLYPVLQSISFSRNIGPSVPTSLLAEHPLCRCNCRRWYIPVGVRPAGAQSLPSNSRPRALLA